MGCRTHAPGGINLLSTDGVPQRLSQYLDALGEHRWDSRQRASFAMYVLGFALADLTRRMHANHAPM